MDNSHYEQVLKELEQVKLELEKRTQELNKTAMQDPLTALPNRTQLEMELARYRKAAFAEHLQFALILINIDSFKSINNTYGYTIGNKVLKKIAQELSSFVGPNIFLAHLGGDEFALIMNKTISQLDASRLVDEIKQRFMTPLQIDPYQIILTFSAGICYFSNYDKLALDLLNAAEIAMFHAKLLGKNNCQYFSQELGKDHKNRIAIEKALRQAIERQEFFLVYQLVYKLKSREPSGIEALLRWRHPRLGEILPSAFITIAEDMGVFKEIGHWVIKEACKQFAIWNKMGAQHLTFSINLSPEQLQQGDLIRVSKDCLTNVHLSSCVLELELSESAIMNHMLHSNSLVNELHQLGFKIAIDNFGRSYSSLAILKNLTIDTLKIDHSFTENLLVDHTTLVIVKSIIALGKKLGLRIVAEGIENAEQLAFYVNEGCDEGQGFYLSLPQTAVDLTNYFELELAHEDL